MIQTITKRDGRTVTFHQEKIADAIYKAAQAIGGHDYQEAQSLAEQVVYQLEAEASTNPPTVEHIQDVVERTLIESGHSRTAK